MLTWVSNKIIAKLTRMLESFSYPNNVDIHGCVKENKTDNTKKEKIHHTIFFKQNKIIFIVLYNLYPC